MFGISDPGVWLAYLLEVLCLAFAAWYGIKYWNQDDESDAVQPMANTHKKKSTKVSKKQN